MSTDFPNVPMTLEGASVLHQMMRVDWSALRKLDERHRHLLVSRFSDWLKLHPASASYAMLGHKGDLMLIHYRNDFAELQEVQRTLQRLEIGDYFQPVASYLSIVELGLYESTRKIVDELQARGLQPGTDPWDQAVEDTLARQRAAMAARLWPEIPEARYICFYPMDRRRGEDKNWYTIPFAERQHMMHEHGLVGRKYGGRVKQIISGSIGFDDWEWGVDLFAEDPLWFKRLIYEMRFDEVSAVYALFGTFYIGLRLKPDDLSGYFNGNLSK